MCLAMASFFNVVHIFDFVVYFSDYFLRKNETITIANAKIFLLKNWKLQTAAFRYNFPEMSLFYYLFSKVTFT